jgi:hypothetical protein
LVAVLVWPWNLALPLADSVDPSPPERAHAQFRAKRPTKSSRALRARTWSVSAANACWEDNDEEEEGDSVGLGTSQILANSFPLFTVSYPRPKADGVAASAPRALGMSLDRLCRLRC